MKKKKLTKIWYIKDNVSYYKEINGCIPYKGWYGQFLYQSNDPSIPKNLWNCLRDRLDGYKFQSRLDGPALDHINNFRYYFIDDMHVNIYTFAEITNHIICNICDNFCKQECFIEEI